MIIRGYIIPKRVGETFLYSRVITPDEVQKIFEDFDSMFKLVLEDFSMEKAIQTANDVNKFLDALTLFFRSMLYRDTIPGIMPATISGIYSFFIKNLTSEVIDFSPESYYDILSEIMKRERIRVREDRLRELQERLTYLLDFPADDRPGANTSSLLLHTLTTSALASASYLNDEDGNRVKGRDFDLALLRLTCFFHDIGKLINWKRHEEESSKYLSNLMSKYAKGEALEIIDIASRLIKREEKMIQGFDKIKTIYIMADRKASEIDRLSKYLLSLLNHEQVKLLIEKAEEYLGKKIMEKEFEKEFEICYECFDYWARFSIEDKLKLTECFCKRASEISLNNPLLNPERNGGYKESEVKVVRYDIRGIQNFIRVNDLRSMSGASLLIDYVTFIGIPLILMQKYHIPAENILYFGGGNVTVILPSNKYIELSEDIEKSVGLKVVEGASPLLESFFETNKEVDGALGRAKLRGYDDIKTYPVDINLFMKCEFCGHLNAESIIDEVNICSNCNKKRDVGDKYHFRYKLEKLEYSFQLIPLYLKKLIEFISGTSRKEIESEQRIKEYKNLAVLRFDANLAGLFMASSISITDAFERSVRIDSSLKEAYHRFLSTLKAINQDYYDRVTLGTIYIGGDDGFLLAPSRIAIHLAITLMNEFYLEMGGRLSLSCGIAVAKPKHPLIPLYEAAGFILDDVVKDNVRGLAYNECALAWASEPSSNFRGALGFYVADGGFIGRESLGTILKELYREGISGQHKEPYLLCSTGSINRKRSILTLLDILRTSEKRYLSGDLSNLSEGIMKDLEYILNDEKKSIDQLKEIRRIIDDILKVEIKGDTTPKIQSLYIKRQEKRLEEIEENKAKIADGILNLLDMKDGEIRLNIYDLLLITKVMIGE
jgi:HD superfamily phosphodiesterase